jgi:L-fuculose-phosphate aldolase
MVQRVGESARTRTSALRRRIVEVCLELERLGLLDLTAGNVSARVDDDAIAITPSGIPYGETHPDDVVVCALADGATVEGSCRPSSELALHRAMYAARPETGAVVHTHSPYATTFAVLGEPIPAVHYMIARLGVSEVPVVAYATYGTEQLARNALGTLDGEAKALLLANHGTLALGADVDDAAINARVLESLAAVCWRARTIGEPRVLPADEIARVRERHRDYGQPARG